MRRYPADEESGLGLLASDSHMTSDTDELLAVRDALGMCPKCQSEDFVDRKVTKESPASPDASRELLA
jgi:hypothetical protein